MNGTVQLHTKRLLLRKVTPEDAAILHRELGCNPEMIRYTCWNPYATSESTRAKVESDIQGYQKEGCYACIIQFGENRTMFASSAGFLSSAKGAPVC